MKFIRKLLIILFFLGNVIVWGYYIFGYTNLYTNFVKVFSNDKKILEVRFFPFGPEVLFKTPTGKYILLNAGRNTYLDVIQYLRKENIYNLDAIILTNPTQTYIGGVVEILHNVPVGVVIDGIISSNNYVYSQIVGFLRYHPEIDYKRYAKTNEIALEPFLASKAFYSKDIEGDGVSLYIHYNNISLFFMNNISFAEQVELTNYKDELKSTFLIYPDNSDIESFMLLKFLAPKNIILRNNLVDDTGMNNVMVWDIAAFSKSNILYPDKDGALVLYTDGETYRIIKE